MAKKKNKLNTKNIVIGSILAAILIFAGIFVYSKNTSVKENDQVAVEEKNEVEIEEEIKDGVYTNYTYGISFKYPTQVFDGVYAWKKSTGKYFFKKGWSVPSLSVEILDNSNKYFDYDICEKTKVGQTVEVNENLVVGSAVYKKVENKNDFCITIVEPHGASGSGYKYWNYSAIRMDYSTSSLIYIRWEESSFEGLISNKDNFDSIINSFLFFEK